MLTRIEATKEGEALLKRMKGNGWKLRVHENGGWHYNVTNGPLYVAPSAADGKFFCLLSDKPDQPGWGAAIWTTRHTDEDPNLAVQHELKEARKVVKRINEVIQVAEEAAS